MFKGYMVIHARDCGYLDLDDIGQILVKWPCLVNAFPTNTVCSIFPLKGQNKFAAEELFVFLIDKRMFMCS